MIILSQDPTVKNPDARKDIKVVLNLAKDKNQKHYLDRIYQGLGSSLAENVYATKLLKNFFVKPPTQIKETDIFTKFLSNWLPVLQEELAQFSEVPVITLGEPVLGMIVNQGANPKVRSYWGYTPRWKYGESGTFHSLNAE